MGQDKSSRAGGVTVHVVHGNHGVGAVLTDGRVARSMVDMIGSAETHSGWKVTESVVDRPGDVAALAGRSVIGSDPRDDDSEKAERAAHEKACKRRMLAAKCVIAGCTTDETSARLAVFEKTLNFDTHGPETTEGRKIALLHGIAISKIMILEMAWGEKPLDMERVALLRENIDSMVYAMKE